MSAMILEEEVEAVATESLKEVWASKTHGNDSNLQKGSSFKWSILMLRVKLTLLLTFFIVEEKNKSKKKR